MSIPILSSSTRWECPNCTVEDVTNESRPHTRFHNCTGLKGLVAPMVAAGSDCRVTAVERQDYVGSDRVQADGEGRPIMAVRTERADGSNDIAVLAPCAAAEIFNLK